MMRMSKLEIEKTGVQFVNMKRDCRDKPDFKNSKDADVDIKPDFATGCAGWEECGAADCFGAII